MDPLLGLNQPLKPEIGSYTRLDDDAVLILDVYSKKTRKIPDEVIDRCIQRLKQYDAAIKAAKKKSTESRG